MTRDNPSTSKTASSRLKLQRPSRPAGLIVFVVALNVAIILFVLAQVQRWSTRDGGQVTQLNITVAQQKVSAGSSRTALKHLDASLLNAPWVAFTEAETYTSHVKSVTGASEGSPAAAAVLRVEVRADAPFQGVWEAFVKPELTQQWNSFVGEVAHHEGGVQLQTYRFPWPLVTREYLVRCVSEPIEGAQGFRSYCASIDSHPKAPLRADRVRGSSETLWQMTPAEGEPNRTTILFEGSVDPRGSVPTRLVNEIGKRTSVSTALALAEVATREHQRKSAPALLAAERPLAVAVDPWGGLTPLSGM
jgi:hypothetical protein